MNINEINSVNDLIEQNNTETPSEKVLEALMELDYQSARSVIDEALERMLEWHRNMAMKAVNEGQTGDIIQWADDAGRLASVLNILKTVG